LAGGGGLGLRKEFRSCSRENIKKIKIIKEIILGLQLISFIPAMLCEFFPQTLTKKRSFASAFTHFLMTEALWCLKKVERPKRFFPRTPMWKEVTARELGQSSLV